MSRFADALAIQQGACNPSGIARTLVKAIDDANQGGVRAREDPAVRLIVHQLAFLCNVDDGAGLEDYDKLIKLCEERK